MRDEKMKQLNEALFQWFKKYGRHDLPWRKTNDPYKILVSEVMLQQTQGSRALSKYDEFLKTFPSIKALAAAPLGAVLRAWSGLGYNRRAKYLWECARIVNAKYSGEFPKSFETLQELPGIGRGTAAALMSFAFGGDEPMIDTNIRRIIVRIFFLQRKSSHNIGSISRSYDTTNLDYVLYKFTKQIIPKGRGRDWNWAMMDVGALVCTAKHHDDAACPFQKLHGAVEDFQYKKPQKKFKGSDRYYRGKIIAALACAPQGLASSRMRDIVKVSEQKFDAVVDGLHREGLVVRQRGKMQLPS